MYKYSWNVVGVLYMHSPCLSWLRLMMILVRSIGGGPLARRLGRVRVPLQDEIQGFNLQAAHGEINTTSGKVECSLRTVYIVLDDLVREDVRIKVHSRLDITLAKVLSTQYCSDKIRYLLCKPLGFGTF